MPRLDRRHFIAGAGATVAGVGTLGAGNDADEQQWIPPIRVVREVALPGIQ